SALRRWGRATMLLEQQNGHIDAAFLRRLLADHYEGMHCEVDPLGPMHGPTALCQHGEVRRCATAASMVVQLGGMPARLLTVWCAFGPPCVSVYFPLFLESGPLERFTETIPEGLPRRVPELIKALGRSPHRWALAREMMSRLQARFDLEAEEFAAEGAAFKERGQHVELQRLATLFLQHNVEQFDEVARGVAEIGARVAVA